MKKGAMGLYGLFFSFCLCACSGQTVKPICPQITPWTADFQRQAATEITTNPALVALPEIARQDVVLRDQVRACQKKVAQ
ncbi:hypothetical protein AD928_08950 [Acetobacter cerevisiae]|uniref:Uncharacterized protein n=1 Tax=Acetobacter cerevisiae TaxID=178900 RepID=A0A149Q7K3_9PROT|nr:hypothetical protein AD928_08950 [Acetobacter cerevisiae]GBQ10301.1 hypothetical protein AA14362_2507 [Acetobacter cerevisiae DSM 14362]